MIRVNVIKDTKQVLKSFLTYDELVSYLRELKIHGVLLTAKEIWNLNVGSAYKNGGYIFALAGKTRVANHLKF